MKAVLSDTGSYKTYKVVYNYSCCSWKTVNTIYHPGDVVKIKWTPFADSSPPNVYLRLTAAIVGPFANVENASLSPISGPGLIRVSAHAIRISNSTPLHPVSVIHIPKNAKPGFYNLVTGIVWLDGSGSGFGASVIRVAG